MKDPYLILGLSKADATDESIKKAYKRLASKHHPDKVSDAEKPAAEAKFKEIKAAYESIETAEKRAALENPMRGGMHGSAEDIHAAFVHAFKAAAEAQRRNSVPFVRINISLERAFNGTTIALSLFGRSISYKVRPGLPQGVGYVDEVPVDDRTQRIQVQLNIEDDKFRFRQIVSVDGLNFSGDLETDVVVDAIDLLAGSFIVATDFLGKKLQVRIPSGHNPKHRLKIAGHGYTNWRGDHAAERGDLYLCLIPRFQSINELDPDKVEALYNATRTPPIVKTA